MNTKNNDDDDDFDCDINCIEKYDLLKEIYLKPNKSFRDYLKDRNDVIEKFETIKNLTKIISNDKCEKINCIDEKNKLDKLVRELNKQNCVWRESKDFRYSICDHIIMNKDYTNYIIIFGEYKGRY